MEGMRERGLNRLPLLWKHMLMMVCVLLLSLTALVISNRQSVKTLTQEHLNKFQIALERDCAKLSDAMYLTMAIPDAVEGTRYYDYIKSVNSGVLEEKYYPVLAYLRKALNNQVYLKGDSAVTLLYLSGTNSIVTNERVFVDADQCFENITFAQTGTETLLGFLRERNGKMVLPVQVVRLDEMVSKPCMAVIMRSVNSRVSVMSIYTRETILEALGFSYLPEDAHIRLTAKDGQVLLNYPEGEAPADSYLLTAELADFQIKAELWIPQDHFMDLLRPVRRTAMISLAVVALIGLVVSFFLSKVSVRPIRRLLSDHEQEKTQTAPDEITRLDALLHSSKENVQQLQDMKARLMRQLLARSFGGAVLNARENEFLLQELRGLVSHYQVAVLHCNAQTNMGLREYIRQNMDGVAVTTLNDKETGVMIPASEEYMERLTKVVGQLNNNSDAPIYCGISAPAEQLDSLHTAVRQARLAMPQERGARLFPGDNIGGGSVSWLQHERLYQSVFSGDRDEALRLLRSIAAQTNEGNSKENYYNMRFAIRSAAEELEISLGEEREYSQNLLPKENVLALEEQLSLLFRGLENRSKQEAENLHSRVMNWIRQNLSNYELSAPAVVEAFGLPEKRVYEIVRAETGMSFREYVTSLRMKKAAQLLRETGDSIADIAQSCGYHGSSTFYRLFQESYGMSPGQYRSSEKTEK